MSPPELIDTHCHLTFGELGEDADGAWRRARDAGVSQAVVVGIDRASSEELVAFVPDRDGLWCSVGVHPNATSAVEEGDWERLEELARAPQVVGIGETGIDRYRDQSPPEVQRAFLHRHAELALATDLPLILHIRDGFAETIEVLEPLVPRGLRGVVHCFTGGPDDLQPFVDWGFFISFSGVLTYSSADQLRAAAKLAPIESCVVETDAPWLAPAPHKSSAPNEPAFVVRTAKKLAKVKGMSFEDLAAATTANARRLFRLSDG